MNDRLPIRDRTLILRILVPGLEARLRDKMKEVEEEQQQQKGNNSTISVHNNHNNSNINPTTNITNKESSSSTTSILDLDGVTCEPTPAHNNTLWNFHCDGATYPAKLINLPCPIELHKTHDHACYYKCADVAQMLIVYEDEMALEEQLNDFGEKKFGDGKFPMYYHSGLTPPLRHVVERRFMAREHASVAPPRRAVQSVEMELMKLMEQIASNESGGGSGKSTTKRSNKVPVLTSANKVLETVEEDIVEYEPWMDDFGRQPNGVQFDDDDQVCTLHPEVWLHPNTIKTLQQEEEDARRKKQEKLKKKKEKKQQKEQQQQQQQVHKKKGIPNKKSQQKQQQEQRNNSPAAGGEPVVDEVTAAAAMMVGAGDEMDLLGDDDFLDLDLDGEDMLNLGDLGNLGI